MQHYHPDISSTSEPALPAPSGEFSNLHSHTNHLWTYNVVAQTVCLSLVGILFFLRCFVRLGFGRMPRRWELEDWSMCLSFFGFVAFSAVTTHVMNGEAGVHQWNLTHQQTQNVLYYFWIESIIYGPIIFFTKFSILLLYLRLLVPTHWSPLWVVNHIIIAISAMFYASITLAKIWQCSPREKTWDDNTPGTCINLPLLLQVSGLFNTISDVLILLVPIKPVSTLRVSWWKKVGICGIFTIGAVAPIFSALGFYARVIGARSRDLTYNNPKILLWGTAEITTGIICACLPTLPSLIRGPRTQSASTFPPNPLSLGRNSETEVKEYIELRESGLETGRGSGQLTRHSQVREV